MNNGCAETYRTGVADFETWVVKHELARALGQTGAKGPFEFEAGKETLTV